MKNTIEVIGIELYAYHGCLPEEAKIGGHYTVDVCIETDFTTSFKSDQLGDTVDYVLVYNIVKEEMAIRSNLIEHVGNRIFQRLFNEILGIQKLKIKIIKHSPPIGGDVKNATVVIES